MNRDKRGKFSENVALARHTTWRVGGAAKHFYHPSDIQDLAYFLASLPTDEPLFWLGLGSNVLIRDDGFLGTVIYTLGGLNGLERSDETIIKVEAGVSCAKVARYCARLELEGGEFLAGIPGTMGGALAMNAGCFGKETWECVRAVETIDRQGHLHQRTPSEYKISYREVLLPTEEYFAACYLQLQKGDKAASLKKIKGLLDRRAETQPTGEHNCGSVFRNPPGNYAGKLIESCGLKGYRLGGAFVSEKHANFIINDGTATALDIENLMIHIEEEVKQHYKIQLHREVKIIGKKKE